MDAIIAMSMSSSPHAVPSRDTYAQSEAKRRRLRKGTHSCWECKRRKMKCIFDPLVNNNTICNGCRRRGSQCVSQEFPDDVSFSTESTPLPTFGGDGIMRVESRHSRRHSILSNETTPLTPPSEDGRRADYGIPIPTPVSMTAEPSRHQAFHTSSEVPIIESNIHESVNHGLAQQGKNERLSRFLHGSLPSREDLEKICAAGNQASVLGHEIMTISYTTLDQKGLKRSESLLEIPTSGVHPVLIAKHMLLLASFLQKLHPDLRKEIIGLSEPPRVLMERLADLAISLVTTNDQFFGYIEGLECVMIESVYHSNIGSLRRSWLAVRRAMNIAQLMGINRSDHQAQFKVLDPKTEYHPQLMWFRIVFLDRYLCLMLGLPQGCPDRIMASDAMLAKETPLGRLERIHCVIASRILERNESKPSSHELALTRTLDVELQKAARSLPSRWWLAPNLDPTSNDSQALFWSTRRLFAQVLHYNLLNQLHLPYMLRSSLAERSYEYSLIACVNASREVLSRFNTLRSFNGIAYSCRTVDFLAHMAAMTLLLAHLDSHLSETENLLAHQYHSDRAMIEQVQENMKEINRVNSDTLSAQSADLLGRLLAIEIETADKCPQRARTVSVQEAGAETVPLDHDDDAIVSVHIPYFGIIKIARGGISKEVPKAQAPTVATNRPGPSRTVDMPNETRIGRQMLTSGISGPRETPNVEAMIPSEASYNRVEPLSMISDPYPKPQGQPGTVAIPANGGANDVATHLALPHQSRSSDPTWEHGEYPGLAAGGEDWALQGIDLAFFENLIRSTGNEGNEDAEWTTVAEASMNNRQQGSSSNG